MTDETVYRIRSRVLKQPRGADMGQQLKYALKRKRLQKQKWPEPEGAYLILNLHFQVYSFSRQSFNAEACLEIPVKNGFEYFTVSGGGNTSASALRKVISEMESSEWFHFMKSKGVYFRVTGTEMEQLYRGYL